MEKSLVIREAWRQHPELNYWRKEDCQKIRTLVEGSLPEKVSLASLRRYGRQVSSGRGLTASAIMAFWEALDPEHALHDPLDIDMLLTVYLMDMCNMLFCDDMTEEQAFERVRVLRRLRAAEAEQTAEQPASASP
jgi:hypothetical protein